MLETLTVPGSTSALDKVKELAVCVLKFKTGPVVVSVGVLEIFETNNLDPMLKPAFAKLAITAKVGFAEYIKSSGTLSTKKSA